MWSLHSKRNSLSSAKLRILSSVQCLAWRFDRPRSSLDVCATERSTSRTDFLHSRLPAAASGSDAICRKASSDDSTKNLELPLYQETDVVVELIFAAINVCCIWHFRKDSLSSHISSRHTVLSTLSTKLQ